MTIHRTVGSWSASLIEEESKKTVRLKYMPNGQSNAFPAQEVRDAYLKIEKVSAALSFFEKYGPFNEGKMDYPLRLLKPYQQKIWNLRARSKAEWFFGERRGSAGISDWFETRSPEAAFVVGHIPALGMVPMLSIESREVAEAIRNINYVDHLMNVEVSWCQVCKRPFQVNTKGRKRYFCDEVCKNKDTKKRWLKKQEEAKKANGKA